MDALSLIPPPDRRLDILYYLEHFRIVKDGARKRYGHLLNEAEAAYLRRLDDLPENALCLYARLANRKGPFFRVGKLQYPEIDIGRALEHLLAAGLVECCSKIDERTIACFTFQELTAALWRETPLRFSCRAALTDWLQGWDRRGEWLEGLLARHPVVRLCPGDMWEFVRFLFFGELTPNLADFVVRDLGLIVPEEMPEPLLSPYFRSRVELDVSFRMARIYAQFREIRDAQPALETLKWWNEQNIGRAELPPQAAPAFDRLVMHLGRRLVRENALEEANELYRTSDVAPNRECRARLLLKLGRVAEAEAVLEAMLVDPCHAEEAYVAAQLVNRLRKTARVSKARSFHIACPELLLDYSQERVEACVLRCYREKGWDGIHSENWIWNALFGLLFWDAIYDPAQQAFHSPLQTGPSDLYQPDFYRRRKDAIDAQLARLEKDAEAALDGLRRTHERKHGTANPFVYWHAETMTIMETLLAHVPGRALGKVMLHMAQDLKRRTRGFPDLFLWSPNAYLFLEVKSENDHLAPHQYQWLQFLRENGIEAGLVRVRQSGVVTPDA